MDGDRKDLREACPVCPDFESWSVNQQKSFYGDVHKHITRFIGIPDNVLSSSMSDMKSHVAGGVSPYTDGYIQRLLSGADTMQNIASSHLAIALTAIEERRSATSEEKIVSGDFALTDANVDDVMSLNFHCCQNTLSRL